MSRDYVELADGKRINIGPDEMIVGHEELRELLELETASFLRWLMAIGVVDPDLDDLELETAYWTSGAGGWPGKQPPAPPDAPQAHHTP